ncbi:hypothetical protein NXF25_006695 [Crotalus adamanteus]|uniref:Ig-like domain-containing protein n=1 Tax=Crotalus adamanteus TaxID=8729 RepID=A0AAW1C1A1_CROAD
MMLEEGQDARLECRQDYGHLNMLWFWQRKQHQDLQLLYNFYNGNIVQKNSSLHRLNADQPIPDLCVLSISVVKPEDSAVYFCASSETTAHQNAISSFKNLLHLFLNCESRVVTKIPWSSQPGLAM